MIDTNAVPIKVLYEAHAATYAAIACDRSIDLEANLLLRIAANTAPHRVCNVVDLFAGPASHAFEFLKFGLNAYAIDASTEMRNSAIDNGYPPSKYLVGDLPTALNLIRSKLDLTIAMRYSIGYLTDDAVVCLLRELRKITNTGGSLILEIHRLEHVAAGFDSFAIRARRFLLPDGQEAECIWPDGPLRWDRESWTAEMDVSVRLCSDVSREILRFVSRERIYSVLDIKNLAMAATGWFFKPNIDSINAQFPQSEIVHLEAV